MSDPASKPLPSPPPQPVPPASSPSPVGVSPVAPAAGSTFAFSTWLFLRLLALIHAVAFASAWVQLDALVGPRGLLPAERYFAAVRENLGAAAPAALPSLCWWFGTDEFLHVLCAAGLGLSLLLFLGFLPALCLALLWAAYLSLSLAGQIFFSFQWDTLLLEATLLAVFLAPWSLAPRWRPHAPPRLAHLALVWLLFRLMFLAGVVKLASGDPTWRDLSALTFHYETQPLPHAGGWFAHQLPAWWHRASCAGMFALELVVPFFLFAPRTVRHNAALLLAALMVAVILTGNYTFFNALALALCLLCLDDRWWRTALGRFAPARLDLPSVAAPRWHRAVATGVAIAAIGYTLAQALPTVAGAPGVLPGLRPVAAVVAPFRSLNNYGLFAVMTHPRPELIFEGSADGRTWLPYEFPHKPGALDRRPTFVAPHQPRLDWQLWFAALGPPQHNPWVLALCEHLLRGTGPVLGLLAHNPFPAGPPRYLRVVRYEYRFTDAATRARTGHWWRRTPLDFYVPASSLK